MTTIKHGAPDTEATPLTTGLNSLADGARVISAALSNDDAAERFLYVDFELDIATQGTARTTGARCELFIVYAIDGTNYTYGSASLSPPSGTSVGNFELDASVTTRIIHLTGIPLRPYNFKIILENQTGQAFAASGTVVSMRRTAIDNL